MTIETAKTKTDIYLGELVKVDSAKETVSLALSFPKMFPDIRKVEEAVSRAERIMPKITCVAFSFVYGLPVIAFFQNDFYGRFRIAEGKRRTVYAYVANIDIPEFSDYGSVYVKNIYGKCYYLPFL